MTAAEHKFLADYRETIKPLTKALDILQSKKRLYEVASSYTQQAFIEIEQSKMMHQICRSLASALIEGIGYRFGAMMEDEELIAAAILIPMFKTEWTAQEVLLEKDRSNIYFITG